MPERNSVLELCCVTLQIRTQALPLPACISLTSWYIPIKIANATQFVVRWVAWTSKTDRHEHFKSATIKTKKVSQNYIISFWNYRFSFVIILSWFSFSFSLIEKNTGQHWSQRNDRPSARKCLVRITRVRGRCWAITRRYRQVPTASRWDDGRMTRHYTRNWNSNE